MTSFGYRLNPRYTIKECSSCRALYTGDFCCSKGNVEDKILVPELPKNCARCARCGHPVDGPYCQGCALLRKKLEGDLVTYFQDFQNTFESSNDSTNVANTPREPFVVKQDHAINSSQNPPHIDERCYECGDALDGIFCQRCTCFDQPQPSQFPIIHPPPQETSIKILQDQENELPEYINTPGWNRPAFYTNGDDDDVDYTIVITPVLSTEEPDNSLSMGDEHLDTIPTTESNEVIKSSVEDLILIPSESEGIPDTMCDVYLVNNHTPLEAKDHFEIVINSNDDYSSSDDDSLYYENIEYVKASPHDYELVILEVAEIVILKVEEIEDDNLREKLLNVNFLIAKIESLKDNRTLSFEFLTKSFSTSPKAFLEETNTFDNSLPEFENFCIDLEEISSGSTTTHSDISLPNYEAFYFYDDHIEEISSGSTTTHSNISLSEYDSFIFDLSNDQFPPTDRSDFTHEEFADELAHIISPPEYDCFYFRNLPDPGEWISSLNSKICENLSSTTRVNLPVEDDHSPLLAYVPRWGNDPGKLFATPDLLIREISERVVVLPLLISSKSKQKISNSGKELSNVELKENFNGMSIEIQKKEKILQHEQWAYLSTHPSKHLNSFCYDDDDEDYTFAITPNEPVLSTEEPDNSLSMGDEHLDTILTTDLDEVIKASVKNLIPIPSESEGILEHKCDVPFHDNSPPLDVSKDQTEDFSKSNDEVSSTDNDSFSIDNIDYVEASPPDSEPVNSEVMEIVIPEVGGIDDDILLTIKDDILHEKIVSTI
nr:hypothetical protein [Tanacetum cinerariifolium]